MRTPIKSEADAFRFAYGTAVVLGVTVILGAVTSPVVGAVFFTLVALGAFYWDVRTRDADRKQPLREAASASPGARDGTWRVLVVANETLGGLELQDAIMERAPRKPQLTIVAPVLPSRVRYLTTDIDADIAKAQRRLDETLAWAAENGLHARGEVGRLSPLMAIEDALRRSGADEVIVSTHPAGRSNWLESGLVDRVREELELPITHVVVERRLEAARDSA